jgi:hypothetical protein
MPTVNLLPDTDLANSPAWTLSTGSDIHVLLADDDTGNPLADGSQITTTSAGPICKVGFGDFDDTLVASITSVQAIMKVGLRARGEDYQIGMAISNNGSGAADWAEEVQDNDASAGWNTHYFTARTTSTSGGSAWTDTDLDNIAMKIHAYALSGNTLRVTYAYYVVTYAAAVSADNATFFGTNF